MKIINVYTITVINSSFILIGVITTSKLMQPIIPSCQHSHSLPLSSRFQLSMLQYFHSEEGKRHLGAAIPALCHWGAPAPEAAHV